MSLRKKLSFEELVQENRKQILTDASLLDKIDEKIEERWIESHQTNRIE